ncbi:MAG: glycine zipper 2TM domain-containing protein [Burkholderiales bacterium]|nr:glycine zipper 2TM domain-containing protein [Burkholderiales bacterium]
MKTVLTIAVLSTLGLSAGLASAAPHSDVATVISATPLLERVNVPRRECYNEQITSYDQRRFVRPAQQEYITESRPNSGGGALLGAIVGGVIGHQFGNSSGGRDRGTAAGAVIGGLIGNNVERTNNNGYDSGYRRASAYEVERVPVTRDVQRCDVVSEYRDEIRGYDVRYNYNGREYSTRMSYDPGPTMPINVDVRPSNRPSNRY